MSQPHYDVVIIGAGLAGLSLARHLLLAADVRVLVLEKRSSIPPTVQKVGEATVQVSAFYLSKVLDLEEHLLREHYLKYNLRFYWKTPGRANDRFEDYSQSFIRTFSNIATYQLDRNKLEHELLRLNDEDPRFTCLRGAGGVDVDLADPGPHRVRFDRNGASEAVTATWVIDASGRGRVLARSAPLRRDSPIHHGASFMWVDGLVDIERLTPSTRRQVRLNPARAAIGHSPLWLATNHLCGEGFWFWIIPLRGKTSLGLVYDHRVISPDDVNDPRKLVEWICREFPLLARDLPSRRVLHASSFREFSYDCARTIDAARWGVTGEAGRFSDPLYSPGGDLIAIYNTLIVDAVRTRDAAELAGKVSLYEALMQAVHDAYVPSYAVSYDALGDQEVMTLKYVWELTVYFGFYVFPFINDLFTDRRFVVRFLRRFAQLGRVNARLHHLLSHYFQWKKHARAPHTGPQFSDFFEFGALQAAERAFYQVGLSADAATEVLDTHLANAMQLARFIGAHVFASVLDDPGLRSNQGFVETLVVEELAFDIDEMERRRAQYASDRRVYRWPWPTDVLDKFRTPRVAADETHDPSAATEPA